MWHGVFHSTPCMARIRNARHRTCTSATSTSMVRSKQQSSSSGHEHAGTRARRAYLAKTGRGMNCPMPREVLSKSLVALLARGHLLRLRAPHLYALLQCWRLAEWRVLARVFQQVLARLVPRFHRILRLPCEASSDVLDDAACAMGTLTSALKTAAE